MTAPTTYNPPDFPRRPKHSTLFTEMRYQWQLKYYQYQINTALYVMSPGEKFAYNTIVLSLFVLFLSAVYYYLPSALYMLIGRLGYYFTGRSRLQVAGIYVTEAVRSSRETMASLADTRKVVNASNPFSP